MLIFSTSRGKMIAWLFVLTKIEMDQTGRNSNQVWHVYATPNNPCVCSVLALATYIFANPSLTNVENFTQG
jgi:hypothetical protein